MQFHALLQSQVGVAQRLLGLLARALGGHFGGGLGQVHQQQRLWQHTQHLAVQAHMVRHPFT